MIKTADNIEDLMVVLRRPDAGAPIRGLVLPRGSLAASLLLRPEALVGALQPLGKLAVRLPAAALSAAQKATRRKLGGPRLGTALRNYAYCVRAAQGILGAANVAAVPWPDPARLDTVAALMDRFAAINRYASQGVTRAMDLRLLVGAYQWYVLGKVAAAVTRRMEDPATSGADRAKLQNSFSGLLLRRDWLLMNAEQRRQQRQEQSEALQAEQEKARRTTALLDVIQAIKMKLPVEPAALEEAARTYAERRGEAQAAKPEQRKSGRRP